MEGLWKILQLKQQNSSIFLERDCSVCSHLLQQGGQDVQIVASH
uniref:Uncharacterized protein n=1 Tax=Rhizophora mucronata TaxID=61149 RepID=A0A2P2KW67_RHIMU